jgi:hypothetical protein
MTLSAGEQIILSIIVGTLAAIVYSLRILVLMERRMARVDINIEKLVKAVLREEVKIEKTEEKIEREEREIKKRLK